MSQEVGYVIFSKQQARYVLVMLNVVIFQCPDLMKLFMILVFKVLSHMNLPTLVILFHVLRYANEPV